MKMEISGDFSREEFIELMIQLKKTWKTHKDTLSVVVREGTEDMPEEKILGVMREIFKDDDEYTEVVVTKEMADDFFGRFKDVEG